MISSTGNSNSRFRFGNKFDKSKVKCYNYQNTGYYSRDCWSPTKGVEENANLVIKENEPTLLQVHNEKIQQKKNMWYLDNGASKHVWKQRQVHGA